MFEISQARQTALPIRGVQVPGQQGHGQQGGPLQIDIVTGRPVQQQQVQMQGQQPRQVIAVEVVPNQQYAQDPNPLYQTVVKTGLPPQAGGYAHAGPPASGVIGLQAPGVQQVGRGVAGLPPSGVIAMQQNQPGQVGRGYAGLPPSGVLAAQTRGNAPAITRNEAPPAEVTVGVRAKPEFTPEMDTTGGIAQAAFGVNNAPAQVIEVEATGPVANMGIGMYAPDRASKVEYFRNDPVGQVATYETKVRPGAVRQVEVRPNVEYDR